MTSMLSLVAGASLWSKRRRAVLDFELRVMRFPAVSFFPHHLLDTRFIVLAEVSGESSYRIRGLLLGTVCGRAYGRELA